MANRGNDSPLHPKFGSREVKFLTLHCTAELFSVICAQTAIDHDVCAGGRDANQPCRRDEFRDTAHRRIRDWTIDIAPRGVSQRFVSPRVRLVSVS